MSVRFEDMTEDEYLDMLDEERREAAWADEDTRIDDEVALAEHDAAWGAE